MPWKLNRKAHCERSGESARRTLSLQRPDFVETIAVRPIDVASPGRSKTAKLARRRAADRRGRERSLAAVGFWPEAAARKRLHMDCLLACRRSPRCNGPR